MKVIVEIPDRALETVRGMVMMLSDNESDDNDVDQAIRKMKEMEDPVVIDLREKPNYIDINAKERKNLSIAIASFAIGKVLRDNEEYNIKVKEL